MTPVRHSQKLPVPPDSSCEAVEGGGDVEVLVMKMEEDDGGKIATGAQRRGSKQGEALTSACLTKLRVAVKRWRREFITVPLRLRPILLRFSPSLGSAPER